MRQIASTDLEVSSLCFGGNVFGWTADRDMSFALLDAFTEAGGNFIDTSDVYPAWADGCEGGESEAIIGAWLSERNNRDKVIVATKVAVHPKRLGLSAANIHGAVDDSLRRLQTDFIDLYYPHIDDATVPMEETLGAFDELIRAGKVRYIGCANFEPERVTEALAVSEREGFARYVAMQDHYNLVERDYENGKREIAAAEGLSTVAYYGLAQGFLTGKYRPGGLEVDSPRVEEAAKYLDERGKRVLAALDVVAAAHETTVSAVSLAWLAAQPTVVSPIASARNLEQLAEILPAATLTLSSDEVDSLTNASNEQVPR